MAFFLGLGFLGFCVGAFGTMIGSGGGFILAPVLLLMYPHESPDLVSAISLAATTANALSGSAAYARMGRIHFRYGLLFALASLPGAFAGAIAVTHVPRRAFDFAFSIMLLAIAGFLFLRPPAPETRPGGEDIRLGPGALALGLVLSAAVGFLSSFLGIGGGIIHVPALAGLLGFPVHLATATSHFILALVGLAGTLTHVALGTFSHGWHRALALVIGVSLGAQIGARLSTRIHGRGILRALAAALAMVGARLFVLALRG